MIAALLLSALVSAPTQHSTPELATLVDEIATPSALEGWAFLSRFLGRFTEQPYGLEPSGACGALPRPWVGPPLADARLLPPPAAGAQGVAVRWLKLSSSVSGDESYIDVDLQLELRAHDVVAGTLLLEHVLAHLEAQPEVSLLAQPITKPLTDGGGLLAQSLGFRLELAERPVQRGRSDWRFPSRELALRSLATRAGSQVPGIRFSPRAGGGARVHNTDGEYASADDLHRLLARLEDARDDVVVAAIELRPADAESEADEPLVDAWSWDADLNFVQRAPAPTSGPQSGLAGFHVLIDVLHGLRGEGVELSGFVPTDRYGTVPPRELDLDEVGRAFLRRTEGLGIEVRRLTVQRQVRGVPVDEKLELAVDLAFHGPDIRSATRLFERLLQGLEVQPEFESYARGNLVMVEGENAVAEVTGFRLAFVVEPRPDIAARSTGPGRSALAYLSEAAGRRTVMIGNTKIQVSEVTLDSGHTEIRYRVMPGIAEDRFSIHQIYNFMWAVERDSDELSVTSVSVRPIGEEPGRWTWELEVTSPRGGAERK